MQEETTSRKSAHSELSFLYFEGSGRNTSCEEEIMSAF